ncbi:MAG: restriction endonuclease subunit S [Chloroflexi bacterium]|nr:restriction endonuclease subunit S [Chloroflexota bacterium]
MKNISQEAFLSVPILVPPLPEQRAIAAILSTWDDAIALTGRLIDALKRRKQALMQLLLTGEVRFPVFAGEAWRTKLLPVCVKLSKAAERLILLRLSIGMVRSRGLPAQISVTSKFRRLGVMSPEGIENSSTKVADAGDLLIVSRTGVGKVAIAPFAVAISQDITRAKPKLTKITPAFFLYALAQN